METTLQNIRKVEEITEQIKNDANMTLLPIPFSSFKEVTDMYSEIVKDLVSKIDYHPENSHDYSTDNLHENLRLFDLYMSEYRVIDGMNQHPDELNFSEWNDRRIKDILKERFDDDELNPRGNDGKRPSIKRWDGFNGF